jgi:hypothetical protein
VLLAVVAFVKMPFTHVTRRRRKPAHALTRADLQDNVSMQTNAGRTGPSERRKPMKGIVRDTYDKADVLELRDIDKPVQGTYGSADVQTAAGGTR